MRLYFLKFSQIKNRTLVRMGHKAPFIRAILNRFLSSCDCFAIDFPIGSNTHFITKQSQETRKIANIYRFLRVRLKRKYFDIHIV